MIGVLVGSASEAGSGGNPNGVVRRKMIKPKMDHAKALSMLGFTTSRALDPSSGQDAKGELNAALSRRMAELEKKKRLAKQKDKTAVCDKASSKVVAVVQLVKSDSRKDIRSYSLGHVLCEVKKVSPQDKKSRLYNSFYMANLCTNVRLPGLGPKNKSLNTDYTQYET